MARTVTATAVVTDREGHASQPFHATYQVNTAVAAKKVIGYWAPVASYSSRLQVVGADGVKARRIYGDLTTGGNNMASQITAAIAAGMLPVVSYKLGTVSIDAGGTGACDAAAQATANYLASLKVPIAVAMWHEPYDDMTAAQFLALQRRLIPFFAAKPSLMPGPILHGWLLDSAANRSGNFETYLADDLFAAGAYEFMGIDSYQTGSASSPGSTGPGDRLAPLLQVMAAHKVPSLPIGVGEFNAFTAAELRASNEQFLSCPNLAWACMWDNTSGIATQLAGDRVTAFQELKADLRALQ